MWFGAVVLIFGGIIALELRYFNPLDTSLLPKAGELSRVTLASVPLQVTIAQTPQELERGLSSTSSLPPDQGMLFVFPKPDTHPFWMKDMKYSLDIFWLDDAGRIVYIAPNISPETYPATYRPEQAAKYVLELNAGFAVAHSVRVGDVVHFQ